MNYTDFIQNIIDTRGQWNAPSVYWEGHHIVPKCLGGEGRTNQKHKNIIRLTAAEHFIAHQLLCELYPDNSKLAYAYWAMCTVNGAKVIATPEQYEQAKLARSKTIGSDVRVKLAGCKANEETRARHAAAQGGSANGFFGKRHTDATRQKFSKSFGKPVRCLNTGEEFCSSYEAAAKLGINRVLINNCCRGKQASTSGGFKFEFINKTDLDYGLPNSGLTKYERRRQIIELRKKLILLANAFPNRLSTEDTKKIAKLATCENKRYLLSLLALFTEAEIDQVMGL